MWIIMKLVTPSFYKNFKCSLVFIIISMYNISNPFIGNLGKEEFDYDIVWFNLVVNTRNIER